MIKQLLEEYGTTLIAVVVVIVVIGVGAALLPEVGQAISKVFKALI